MRFSRAIHLAGLVELPECDVVREGEVVGGVPVEAVGEHVERHRVDHLVDGCHHLRRKGMSSLAVFARSHSIGKKLKILLYACLESTWRVGDCGPLQETF